MNKDDEKQETASLETDPDLKSLDQVLSQFSSVVFPLPSDLEEASDEKVAELMKLTASARAGRKFRIIRNPKIILALAASISILIGGGVLLSTMRTGNPSIVIAMAVGGQSGIYRGGSAGSVALPAALETGIKKAMDHESSGRVVPLLRLDDPEPSSISDASLARIAETTQSRILLYVTQDMETGDFVLIAFDSKSGHRRAEKHLDAIDAQTLEQDVFRVVSEWLQDGIL